MELEKLKDMLYNAAGGPVGVRMCHEAVDAIEQLQAANEKLRAELEQVKRERDAAIEDLRGKCSACANYTPYHNDGPCATCKFEIACFVPEKATDKWQWRGPKED